MGPLVKVKNSDDYIKLFDTLLSFTASVGPELIYYPAFMLKILIVPNFWPVLYRSHYIPRLPLIHSDCFPVLCECPCEDKI